LLLLLVAGACSGDPEGPTPSSALDGATSSIGEAGDPATWDVDPGEPPTVDATSFTALVTRLGCNSGVTGRVLRPGVVESNESVVVTFNVEPDLDGGDCPGNAYVEYTVDLEGAIGDRALVDGACEPGLPAATTSFCGAGGTRWTP
jgi:hypothetical protein